MSRPTVAYTAPFGIFLIFLALTGGLESWHLRLGGVEARYWVYPLQTVVCAGVLAWFWRDYDLGRYRRAWLAVGAGVLALVVWVAPQWLWHRPPRIDGFNPEVFRGQPALYWGELAFRFLRLVLVVPALEEIFWRGFLLRFLIKEEFLRVPFGTYGRLANCGVALGFMFEHGTADWAAALATGFLYNLVAFNTRSLRCCMLAHAVTNGLLGIYIMTTHQWGFW